MHLNSNQNPGVWPWTVCVFFFVSEIWRLFSNCFKPHFLLGPAFSVNFLDNNSECTTIPGLPGLKRRKALPDPGQTQPTGSGQEMGGFKEASTKAFGLFRMAISIWCSSRAGANALPVAFWRKPRTFYESLRIIQRSLVKVMEWLFFCFWDEARRGRMRFFNIHCNTECIYIYIYKWYTYYKHIIYG